MRENEERYRKAQKLEQVGNWEYNIQTTEFWGSGQAKCIYGFDPEADHSTTEEIETCIPDRSRVHQAPVDLIETDQEYHLEFDIITHDMQERKTIVSLAEVEKDIHGNPLKATGVIQDITECKRVQKLLETERQRLFSVLELIPAFVYLQTKNYSISFANHTFRELFGDPGSRPCYEVIHGRSEPCQEYFTLCGKGDSLRADCGGISDECF